MENAASLEAVAKELGIVLKQQGTGAKQQLVERINEMILHDFNRLLSILYRMDVNEDRVNAMLKQHQGNDAAEIIAALMMERELQKIRSRQQFKRSQQEDDGEEKW